jgi:hypothetical protein
MTQEVIRASDVGAITAAELAPELPAGTLEITEWLKRLDAWAADETDKENVRLVIARTEEAWNKVSDNTETAVKKYMSADHLKAYAVGNWQASLDAFLAAQED